MASKLKALLGLTEEAPKAGHWMTTLREASQLPAEKPTVNESVVNEMLNQPVSRRTVLEGAKNAATVASMGNKLGALADMVPEAAPQAISLAPFENEMQNAMIKAITDSDTFISKHFPELDEAGASLNDVVYEVDRKRLAKALLEEAGLKGKKIPKNVLDSYLDEFDRFTTYGDEGAREVIMDDYGPGDLSYFLTDVKDNYPSELSRRMEERWAKEMGWPDFQSYIGESFDLNPKKAE